MATLENRIVVGTFRRTSEWMSLLKTGFDSLGSPLQLSDEERAFLHQIIDLCVNCVYPQVVLRIEISFDNLCLAIQFVYDDSEETQDELDFSLLSFGSWNPTRILFSITVTDVQYARFLGLSRIESSTVGRCSAELRPLASAHLDSADEPATDTGAEVIEESRLVPVTEDDPTSPGARYRSGMHRLKGIRTEDGTETDLLVGFELEHASEEGNE
jgi:hypothetical protein